MYASRSFCSGITYHIQRVRNSCKVCNLGNKIQTCHFKWCRICQKTRDTGQCQDCLVKKPEKCDLCKKETSEYSCCYIRRNCSSMDWINPSELSNMDQRLAVICKRCEGDNTTHRIFTRLSKSLDPAKGLKESRPLTEQSKKQ